MTYKWIRKSFLIAISFLTVCILFSCKHKSGSGGQTEEKEFVVTFKVMPVAEASNADITATVDDVAIKSGDKVKKGKKVIFVLKPKGDYSIEEWLGDGVEKDSENALKASAEVTKNITAIAKIMISNDPALKLNSLEMFNKNVDISNLSNIKVEVENFVRTISSADIKATFTYGSKTVPEAIKVKVDKNNLADGETSVSLIVPPVKGSYKPWTQEVKITRKAAPQVGDIHDKVQLQSIEVAILTSKLSGGQYTYSDYASVQNYNPEEGGPYTATSEAQTAYVALRVKAAKPDNGDYDIELNNITSYVQAKPTNNKLARLTGGDADYLALKKIPLSKGVNILELKVKNDGREGKYTVVVKYDGGPDPLNVPFEKRKMLSGVYCPAPRKALDGETPDYVWLMGIAGW